MSDAVVRNNFVFRSGSGISSYLHAAVAQIGNFTIINNSIYSGGACLFSRWGR